MNTDRDTTPIVRSWLRTDEHVSADRLLDDVLTTVDSTPQRRSHFPAWRFPSMNMFARVAGVATAVAVVVVGAAYLVPRNGGPGGAPTSPPSSAAVAPSPSLDPGLNDYTGDLRVGRYSLTFDGVPLSFSISTGGWEPGPIKATSPPGGFTHGTLLISKSVEGTQSAEGLVLWTTFPSGADASPCGDLLNQPVGSSPAELAAAIAAAPGTELVSGPSTVQLGGFAASRVVVTVREDLGCDPGYFYTWNDERWGAFWPGTSVGDTITVWTLDVNGTIVVIEAEASLVGTSLGLDAEIQQIVDSIQFETL